MSVRVLHVVKTSDGAVWAARQAAVLTSLGVEVHVALPSLTGQALSHWHKSGAVLHECDLNLPVSRPFTLPAAIKCAQRLVADVKPDLIHSHFVSTTLLLRLALRNYHSIPRLFQVPGPLHLEHGLYRRLELSLADPTDYWIGSSRCIVNHYTQARISPARIFLSYYGDEVDEAGIESGSVLREKASASPGELLVGSISWMYPPKFYLGQRVGVKAHEDLIEALGMISRSNRSVRGVIAGAAWGGANWYMKKLQKRAQEVAGDRISFTGALPWVSAKEEWRDLELAAHVPISENCGGVIEPLLAGVPVIASHVGGLPEVIFDGLTGRLVPPRQPRILADTILQCLNELEKCRAMASRGRQLVQVMFDVQRTAREISSVYDHILAGGSRPEEFDSRRIINSIAPQVLQPRTSRAPVQNKLQRNCEYAPSCPR